LSDDMTKATANALYRPFIQNSIYTHAIAMPQ